MDRDEAIKLLKGGKAGIAEWKRRQDTHEVIPDLDHTDFSNVDICDVKLSGVNLKGANLEGVKLSGARLDGADLSRANLSRAKLRWADLSYATLSGANLSLADLTGTKLSSTELDGADLSRASCGRTKFIEVDLSETIGLESVKHDQPSIIDVGTLLRSEGRIPEAFLRGCGAPDALIEYLPLVFRAMQPIQFYSCLISHSSRDQAFADRLRSRMIQEKLRVWYAPEDMRGGRRSVEQIDQAIRLHDKLLLVLSKASMASQWVLHEIRRAIEREKCEKRQVLFPIALAPWKEIKAWSALDSDSGQDLAKLVRAYHLPDFSKWKDHDSFEKAFARLLDDLKAEEPSGTDVRTPK
jgi:uncharacterized protein YjbI with pentapeptide repeats